MSGKILFVDDDINILAGFHRGLQPEFSVTNALGGAAALKTIDEKGPFAVIVSDMRMPKMTGLEFLAQAYQKSPASVQIILTGNADVRSAIEAMNSGRIFRYLEKPCPNEILVATLHAALDHYALQSKQRTVLQETVSADLREELESLNRQVSNSERELEMAKQHAVASAPAVQSALDPVTGLPSAAEAENTIRSATTHQVVNVVAFALRQLRHARARFGTGVVDQLFHFAAQSLANRLSSTWAVDGLLRWHGDCFLVLVNGTVDLEEVRAEAKNLAAFPLDYHFETRSRNAYIPVRIAAHLISGKDPDAIFTQLNQFVESQRG